MRQRVGIAQAVLTRPSVVLLDEPVSSLDPERRRDMLLIIRDLAPTSTVLLSSHVLDSVARICDRVATIDAGRLVIESEVAELFDRFAGPVYLLEVEARAADALPALAESLRARPWVTSVEVSGPDARAGIGDDPAAAERLRELVVEHHLPLVSLERMRPTLEDVFLRLTGATHGDAARDRPGHPARQGAAGAVAHPAPARARHRVPRLRHPLAPAGAVHARAAVTRGHR